MIITLEKKHIKAILHPQTDKCIVKLGNSRVSIIFARVAVKKITDTLD